MSSINLNKFNSNDEDDYDEDEEAFQPFTEDGCAFAATVTTLFFIGFSVVAIMGNLFFGWR